MEVVRRPEQRAKKPRKAQAVNATRREKVRESKGVTQPHSHDLGQACTVSVTPETTGYVLATLNKTPPPLSKPPPPHKKAKGG